jgi:hypothetical protein
MTQPLAILNDEELHWLCDLGLPNQRRWLNHRTLGDEHRRTFPSAARDSNTRVFAREAGVLYFVLSILYLDSSRYFTMPMRPHAREQSTKHNKRQSLTQRQLSGSTLFVFEAGADFKEAIEHLGALGAAGRELRVGLLVHVLEAMKFVGDVQGGENGDLQ